MRKDCTENEIKIFNTIAGINDQFGEWDKVKSFVITNLILLDENKSLGIFEYNHQFLKCSR